jgi:16S rRNA (uracil1498-N3)-methyltransferase
MHLFYSPDISNIFSLPPEESKHCIKVLRLKIGDIVHLTDGIGNLYTSKIIDDNFKRCILEIIETQKEFGKKNFRLHMAVAPTKNINRYEWFLEKATEMGIDEITPLICDNSERKIVKTDRLNKVIISAMKQSLKTYLPKMNDAVKYTDFISGETADSRFIAYCSDDHRDLLKNVYEQTSDCIILIGPEGDFSLNEVNMAISKDYKPVSLGQSRLRTETAAIAACHTINLINE